jgi:hypothetical protein
MWDFVDRTLGFAYMCPPTITKQNASGPFEGIWEDVQSRSMLTAMLLLDQPAGRLDMMVDMTYPGQTVSRISSSRCQVLIL